MDSSEWSGKVLHPSNILSWLSAPDHFLQANVSMSSYYQGFSRLQSMKQPPLLALPHRPWCSPPTSPAHLPLRAQHQAQPKYHLICSLPVGPPHTMSPWEQGICRTGKSETFRAGQQAGDPGKSRCCSWNPKVVWSRSSLPRGTPGFSLKLIGPGPPIAWRAICFIKVYWFKC